MKNVTNAKITEKDMEELRKRSGENKQPAPKKKTSPFKYIKIFVGIAIAIAYYVLLIFGKYFLDEKGEFLQSLNIFSGAEAPNKWIRIVSICILTLSISFVLRFIIGRMTKNKSITKKTGVALLELLASLVKYASYVVLIFMALSALGVDTTELLAGLGIITLIVGLGMTSLIEDIVAGIFIIAEHLFDVGDIIVVDGFRGTVVSIGIRSTKIADIGNDVLTVRNSSIGSIVNLTDNRSCAAITIPLAQDENLEKVEQIIRSSSIEHCAGKYSDIMDADPMYLGVCEITPKGLQSLLFIAPCHESKRYDVERALFHEIKYTFEQNNIKLGAPPILEDKD